jgi:hypothetical protein
VARRERGQLAATDYGVRKDCLQRPQSAEGAGVDQEDPRDDRRRESLTRQADGEIDRDK